MNIKSANRIIIATRTLLVLGLLTLGNDVGAQSIFAPRTEYSITPAAVQQYQADNQMDVFAPPEIVTRPDDPPLQWGPVSLRPNLFYRFVYSDGIPGTNGSSGSTTIQDFSPGFLFNIGNHWNLAYTPTWRFYSDREFRDTLDHNVRLAGGTAYKNWFFGLAQSYASSSAPLAETGTQTDQETYLTTLTASYRFNSKMTTDLMVNQNFSSADEFTSSHEWSTLDWLNYEFWPRLNAGIGAGFGYIDERVGSDATYEQFQGRVNWRATDKLSFQLHGGVEVRQFLDSNGGNLINPVAGGEIQYQPFEVTRLSLGVNRTVQSSLYENQSTEILGLVWNLNQRLLGRLYLDLSGTYQTSTYVASTGDSTGRDDDYVTFNAKLGCSILKRGTVAVFYQYGDNSSTESDLSFSSNQVGFEAGYRF